jgi:cytochrome c553
VSASWKLAALLASIGFSAGAAVSLGVVPLGASSEHWAVTRWFLETVKHRTVAARTWRTSVPPLDDEALVVRGAGHFETACRPCHGAPGSARPETLRTMLPRPPGLSERVRKWSEAELFWIVKHGIKFTGMPGWPDQRRDDEVWAMIAFLRRLPEMDEDGYRTLAYGEDSLDDERILAHPGVGERSADAEAASRLATLDPAIPAAVESCNRCHGADGGGRGFGAFPRLAGQQSEYLANALQAYADGRRSSGIMRPLAAALDATTRQSVARHFATRSAASPSAQPPDAAAVARGAEIARRGVPAQRVPACVQCHGPAEPPRNPAYPRLAGQYAPYLELQLQLFHDGRRGGSAYAHLMRPVAQRLSEAQRKDVAAYFASLAPSSEPSAP